MLLVNEEDLDLDCALDWDLCVEELGFLALLVVDEEIDFNLSFEDLSCFEDEECLRSASLSLSFRCEDLDFFDFLDLDREWCLSDLSAS